MAARAGRICTSASGSFLLCWRRRITKMWRCLAMAPIAIASSAPLRVCNMTRPSCPAIMAACRSLSSGTASGGWNPGTAGNLHNKSAYGLTVRAFIRFYLALEVGFGGGRLGFLGGSFLDDAFLVTNIHDSSEFFFCKGTFFFVNIYSKELHNA